MQNFTAVTTFDIKKHHFSKEMVDSFIVNWPDNVNLVIFMENSHLIKIEHLNKKVQILDYHKTIPEYEIFVKNFNIKKNLQMILDSMSFVLHTKFML